MTDRDPIVPFRQSDRDALRKAVDDINWLRWVLVVGVTVLGILHFVDPNPIVHLGPFGVP